MKSTVRLRIGRLILAGQATEAANLIRRPTRSGEMRDVRRVAQLGLSSRFTSQDELGLALAPRLLEVGQREHEPRWIGLSYYLTASDLHAAGEQDLALCLLELGRYVLTPLGPSPELACTLLEQAELLQEMDRFEKAGCVLSRGCAVAHELRDARLLAWALYLNGRSQPWEDALLSLLAALELSTAFPCPHLQWSIHWAIARKARDGGFPSLHRDYLIEAYRTLQELQAPLSDSQRRRFRRVPAHRAFLNDWRHLPPARVRCTADSDYLLHQREECRLALPSYVLQPA
ncbi:MAG: hypothetical protein HYY16_10275 [Planctomycetes bacterium]|nr:hypothetical protein [Planctomycetota bacterium]